MSLNSRFTAVLSLVFLFNLSMGAQSDKITAPAFKANPVAQNAYKSLDKSFKKYALFTINTELIAEHTRLNKDKNIQFNLVLPGLENFNLTLSANDILSPDYKVIIASASEKRVSTQRKQITYEGTVNGDLNTIVRLTITNTLIHGIIKTTDKEYFIEPLNYVTGQANLDVFVIYETKDVIDNQFGTCGVTTAKNKIKDIAQNRSQLIGTDCYRITVALASDESAVTTSGGTVESMEVFNIAMMNTVAPYFFESVFTTEVELLLAGQYISTDVVTDPYSVDCSSCGINDQLNHFGTWVINGGFGGITYDLSHNITSHFPPPGVVGLAYVGVLGNQQFNHAVSNISGPSSWLTFIHELGHNFGLSHSFEEGQGTTGGFMDYGDGTYNGAYGFNPIYRPVEFEAEILSAATQAPSANHVPIVVCSSIGAAVADFSVQSLVCQGSAVQLVNTSIGGPTGYSWTFTGATTTTSIERNPTVTFSGIGEQTVSLTTTNENGSTSISKTILIIDPANSNPCTNPGTVSGTTNDAGSTFFQLGTINKISNGCQTDGNYYFDYTCSDKTVLEEGTTYNVESDDPYYSQGFTRYQLFIDYNNDGLFTGANEAVYAGMDRFFSFTTPATGTVKDQLLRARLIVKIFSDTVDPCFSFTFGDGQVEDYGVYFSDNNLLTLDDVASNSEFSIYPNPTRDGTVTITRTHVTNEAQLFLYNAIGQVVFKHQLSPELRNTLNLGNQLAGGVYFVKVVEGQNQTIKKLIIQ